MTDKKLTVTLEGKAFHATVPLTLGQLQDLRVAVVEPTSDDPKEEVKRDFQRSIGIIVAALGLENTTITAESLLTMRVHNKEFGEAVTTILVASGFLQKDAAPGEVKAGTKAA